MISIVDIKSNFLQPMGIEGIAKFEDHSLHASRPSRLCAQAQSGDDMPFQVRSAITDDGAGGSKSGKERFKEFANNSGVIGGERFFFDPYRQVVDSHKDKGDCQGGNGLVFENQSSTSGTLPSNTIPNPKGEMKPITTRSGVTYDGPSIPTPKKVVEQETEETKDKEKTNFQGSTAHIQPLVTPIQEPDVPKTLPKPNIPYPSRINDQKLHEKATSEMDKFF
nr:reverse transcriptase domain-containing protein [Tanacetum cinerariifolium]